MQHDDAPPHNAMCSRLVINQMFLRWIGRKETVDWPACLPDLTLLDFFLWGFIKKSIHVLTTTENMKNRIHRVYIEIKLELY